MSTPGGAPTDRVRPEDPSAIAILIVDDHALFRSGLRMILKTAFAQASFEEAASIEALLQDSPAQAPDIILLDIRLGGLNGLESLAILKRRWPQTPIIMLSSDADSQTVKQALERGAAAFVSKAQDSEEIIRSIRAILAPGAMTEASPIGAGPQTPTRLTARQCEVLHFLDQGLSNKLIARKLALSENTVRGHVQAILALLDSTSRAQAVYKARQAGLID